MVRYRCTIGCDFDLCDVCYSRQPFRVPRSRRVIEVGSRVEALGDAAGRWYTGVVVRLPPDDIGGLGRYAIQCDVDPPDTLTYTVCVRLSKIPTFQEKIGETIMDDTSFTFKVQQCVDDSEAKYLTPEVLAAADRQAQGVMQDSRWDGQLGRRMRAAEAATAGVMTEEPMALRLAPGENVPVCASDVSGLKGMVSGLAPLELTDASELSVSKDLLHSGPSTLKGMVSGLSPLELTDASEVSMCRDKFSSLDTPTGSGGERRGRQQAVTDRTMEQVYEILSGEAVVWSDRLCGLGSALDSRSPERHLGIVSKGTRALSPDRGRFAPWHESTSSLPVTRLRSEPLVKRSGSEPAAREAVLPPSAPSSSSTAETPMKTALPRARSLQSLLSRFQLVGGPDSPCCVEETFRAYCGQNQTSMDNRGFEKLCRECGLYDKKTNFGSVQADLVFAQAVSKCGKRRLELCDFEKALSVIAAKTNRTEKSVREQVAKSSGPVFITNRSEASLPLDDKCVRSDTKRSRSKQQGDDNPVCTRESPVDEGPAMEKVKSDPLSDRARTSSDKLLTPERSRTPSGKLMTPGRSRTPSDKLMTPERKVGALSSPFRIPSASPSSGSDVPRGSPGERPKRFMPPTLQHGDATTPTTQRCSRDNLG